MSVCILIPAYNAAKTVREVAEECLVHGLSLVVVDDGSDDGTAESLAGVAVTLLRHTHNQGKGAALKTGFAWALQHGFAAVVTIDADGQHDPKAIPYLLEMAEKGNYGILLASRNSQFEQMAGLRKIWNRFGVWCLRKRTGFEITDSQSGFRYYSADLLSSVQLEQDRYDLEMELLMKCWKNGFAIGSVPVPARVADGRATSHFKPVQDTWSICRIFLKQMI